MVGYSSIATIGLRPPPDDVGRQKGCKVRIARHSGVIRMASASRLSVPMVLVRMRVADPEFAKSPGAPFKSERWTGIQFISTVWGAAPTDGIELIRKRLPSG